MSASSSADALADPKDRVQTLERYRAAIEIAGARQWREAIGLLQAILADDPDMPDLWTQLAGFAGRLDRFDLAADALKRYIELRPSAPEGYLGAAVALLKQRKVEDARALATRAEEVAADSDRRSRAAAHDLLARIALARHDADGARQEAALAHKADPRMPLLAFIDARLLYDQGRFEEALPLFEQSLEEHTKAGNIPLADLHYYAADAYARLERYDDAEAQFTAELRDFPYHLRARAGLATLYHTMGRNADAARAIGEMTDILPTPESYTLAAKLWATIGNRLQAEAVRAELRERFAEPSRRTVQQP